MAHLIIKPRTHEEWLQCRQQGIGSSEVGTIIGVNPYETPYALWARKKGILPRKEENFLMKAGHYLEDAVSKFYADETGAHIVKSSAGDWLVVDPEHDWRRVSPDRYYWAQGDKHSEANKRILECKTTQYAVDTDALPRYWYCQLQYQLGVAELQNGALAWLTQGREFGFKEIPFNADFFAWMMEQVDEFYMRYIEGNEEPLISNAEDVVIKYPNSLAGKAVDANADITITDDLDGQQEYNILDVCGRLRYINSQIGDLEKDKERCQGILKTYMADAELLMNGDTKIASWKCNSPTRKIDSKRLQAEQPDIFEKYSSIQQGARVFRFK